MRTVKTFAIFAGLLVPAIAASAGERKQIPITKRSRDNFPNPQSEWDNPYVPSNSPAIGDLFDFFQFEKNHGHGRGSEGGQGQNER